MKGLIVSFLLSFVIGCGSKATAPDEDPFFIGSWQATSEWHHTVIDGELLESDVVAVWTFNADGTYAFTRTLGGGEGVLKVIRLLPRNKTLLYRSSGTWRLTGCDYEDWQCGVVGYRLQGEGWHWGERQDVAAPPGPVTITLGAFDDTHIAIGRELYERVP